MTRILIILSIFFVGYRMWVDFHQPQYNIPQFTVEEMELISIEEGI